MEINLDLTKKHYIYPSIEQFRNIIHNVKHQTDYIGKDENGDAIYQTKEKPVLSFVGTTKLHGTNAGVVVDFSTNEIYFQSREHIITPAKDNAGFAMFMSKIQQGFINCCKFSLNHSPNRKYIIYGEWCGGSIQKGVGLNKLPKMFVIFDIASIDIETEERIWLHRGFLKEFSNHKEHIYNIYEFPTWIIDIDFNNPELVQNQLIELTQTVEDECPVSKQLGATGELCGGGIVWKCITPGYEDSQFWMKVKGTKHSSSKVKTIASVNIENIESIKNFVELTVTENRCKQSLQKLKEDNKPLNKTSLGDYLRWIHNDIMKEEIDTIVANGFDPKILGQPISNKAREWFFKNELNFSEII